MLSDVINAGTGWQARKLDSRFPRRGRPARRTTIKMPGSWASRRSLATGVWVGYDQPRTIIGNGYAGDLAVPLWGRFMAAATRGDKPEGFASPANVSGATICRLTGKLATDACRNAVVFDEDGSRSTRSAVYTEVLRAWDRAHGYCEHGTERADGPCAGGPGACSSGAVPAVGGCTSAHERSCAGRDIRDCAGRYRPHGVSGIRAAGTAAAEARVLVPTLQPRSVTLDRVTILTVPVRQRDA